MFILLFFIVLSFYKRIENNTNMPISDIVKRRLGTNPRRRFLLWHQSGHFTAKPPAKKQVFVQYPIGGDEEDRTLDLTDANRTLSQLSYAPIGLLCDYKIFFAVCQVFGGGLEKFFFAAPVFMPSTCRHRPSFRAWSIPRARRESALSCCCCCRRRGIPY